MVAHGYPAEQGFVSGTVEILFRTHTDASRGVANTLIPKGCELTGYGRLRVLPAKLFHCFKKGLFGFLGYRAFSVFGILGELP